MTISDLIKKQNKDYDYIEFRMYIDGKTVFCGSGESKCGELFFHDENDYDFINETVISYEEWSNVDNKVINGLTIVFLVGGK